MNYDWGLDALHDWGLDALLSNVCKNRNMKVSDVPASQLLKRLKKSVDLTMDPAFLAVCERLIDADDDDELDQREVQARKERSPRPDDRLGS